MTWRVLAGVLRTGQVTTVLPVTACSWSTQLNGPGSISATMHLDDPRAAAADPRTNAEPVRCFLAVEADSTILAAGPVWQQAYSWDSGDLSISAAGLWSLLTHRVVIPASYSTPQAADTIVSGVSHGTIAKRLVEQAMAHTGGDLPVVLPAEEAGSRAQTYRGYELKSLGDALGDLTQQDAGPDIRFTPRRRPTAPTVVEWVMTVGTEAAPEISQTGGDWQWTAGVPRSSVVSIDVTRDGTAFGTRAWVTGAGTERTMLMSRTDSATLVAAGYPLVEVDESRTTVEVQATLDRHAGDLLTRSGRALETWSVSVRADDYPKVGTYAAGDYAVVDPGPHDPYLPAGGRRLRIIGLEGDLGRVVKLTMAPL